MRIAGGLPSRPRNDLPSGVAERPAEKASDFSYRPSGDIIVNSSYRKLGGRADLTTYSQIRFPLQRAAAFVHSQSFRNGRSRERPIDESIGSGIPSAKLEVL